MGDIERLRSFLAIHRTGSVTEAAKQLHMSQPAVTQQLQALEATSSKRLFRRLPRGVEPTPAGRELAASISLHLDSLEESWGQWLGAVSDDANPLRGSAVYLGGPSEFLVGRVLPTLAPLITAGLRVRVRAGDDALVLQALEAREIDFAVLTSAEHQRGLSIEPLWDEEFILVAAPDVAVELGKLTPDAGGARSLEGTPLLAYAEELPLIQHYWAEVFDREPHDAAAIVADSLPALASLAERGLGITVLPRHVCEDSLASGRLVQLVAAATAPSSQLHLAWWSGSLRSAASAAVHERLHELHRVASEQRQHRASRLNTKP